MKETGIIMSGSHPRDIIEGRKTMTRRTWGLKEINKNSDEWVNPYQLIVDPRIWTWRSRRTGEIMTIKCPYGQVGDWLRVKETFSTHPTHYRADGYELQDGEGQWHPSIFMPRGASRITREITGIRAERLQDITPEDCILEGISPNYTVRIGLPVLFAHLWDSLNAKRGYSWVSSPWVWVISFKEI